MLNYQRVTVFAMEHHHCQIFSRGKSTKYMTSFNSYVCLLEGMVTLNSG